MADANKKLEKNDFIELDFTGKDKEGNVFDTSIKEEAEKIGLEIEAKPLIICLGQNMLLPAIDEFLIGKETGNHVLELKPEKAFGKRDRKLVKLMPSSIFKEQKPMAGMVFSFDNMAGKILSVSGGRILVDFNNPLADKEVIYSLNIKRKIENLDEKVKSFIRFFFRRDFNFKIEDKKLVIDAEKNIAKIIEMFGGKFKEILNLDLEVKEVEAKQEEKPEKAEENPQNH